MEEEEEKGNEDKEKEQEEEEHVEKWLEVMIVLCTSRNI